MATEHKTEETLSGSSSMYDNGNLDNQPTLKKKAKDIPNFRINSPGDGYEQWNTGNGNGSDSPEIDDGLRYTEWNSSVDIKSNTSSQALNLINGGLEPGRKDVVWSDEFHDLLIALANAHGGPDEERLFENLRKLELDFVYTAETWGRVIIEELFLPEQKKTIKPLKGHGFLGGFKYEVRGVFFKFAHEIQDLVSSNDASKLSAHELRACSAVALYSLENADSSLLPPLMALVDFRGYRLLAVSQLPVSGDETLVYGSNDGGKTVRNSDKKFAQAIARMGKHFNLASHISGVDDTTILYTGTDVEGHLEKTRGRYYILDLARLFPPESPSGVSFAEEKRFNDSPSCSSDCRCRIWRQNALTSSAAIGTGSEGSGSASLPQVFDEDMAEHQREVLRNTNPRLFKQLRPFFVQQKDSPPLSSDAFSRFQSKVDAAKCNEVLEQQTNRLKTVLVQRACVYLHHRENDSELYPTHFSFAHFLHERGLNVRLLGLMYLRLPPKCRWTRIILVEMVARAFKTLVRARFRSLARLKGGEVLAGSVSTIFRASAEDFHEEAVRLLTLLVMNVDTLNTTHHKSDTKEREDELMRGELFRFWERIVFLMKHKFGLAEAYHQDQNRMASVSAFLCPVRLPELLKPLTPKLFERACECLGFQVSSTKVFSQPVSPDSPLSVDTLQDLKPQVKHMNLIHVAEAKVLHHKAMRERNQRACEMLRKARTRLEMVLKESPPTSSFFLLETLGDILFSLAIRIQPERMEFELADEALRNLMKAEGAFREIAARSKAENDLVELFANVVTTLTDGVHPSFLSRASSHPLVLKTQQAKRYANVVSSNIMNDLGRCRYVGLAGDVVVACSAKDIRFWSLAKKSLLWTCQTEVDLTCCASIESLGVFAFAKAGGERLLVIDAVTNVVMEANLGLAPGSEKQNITWMTVMDDATVENSELVCMTAGGAINIFKLSASGPHAKRRTISTSLLSTYVVDPESAIVGLVATNGKIGVAEKTRVRLFSSDFSSHDVLHPPSSTFITAMDMSEDASRVAVGLNESMVVVWEGNERVVLRGHLGSVTAVRFAGRIWPNQDTLFSCSADRTVRVWNVRLQVCVRVLAGHLDTVQHLVFAEKEKMLVTSSADSRVRTWRFDHVPFLPVNSPDNPIPFQVGFSNVTITGISGSNVHNNNNNNNSDNKGRKRRAASLFQDSKACFGLVHVQHQD